MKDLQEIYNELTENEKVLLCLPKYNYTVSLCNKIDSSLYEFLHKDFSNDLINDTYNTEIFNYASVFKDVNLELVEDTSCFALLNKPIFNTDKYEEIIKGIENFKRNYQNYDISSLTDQSIITPTMLKDACMARLKQIEEIINSDFYQGRIDLENLIIKNSNVLLKNNNVLPLKSGDEVYIDTNDTRLLELSTILYNNDKNIKILPTDEGDHGIAILYYAGNSSNEDVLFFKDNGYKVVLLVDNLVGDELQKADAIIYSKCLNLENIYNLMVGNLTQTGRLSQDIGQFKKGSGIDLYNVNLINAVLNNNQFQIFVKNDNAFNVSSTILVCDKNKILQIKNISLNAFESNIITFNCNIKEMIEVRIGNDINSLVLSCVVSSISNNDIFEYEKYLNEEYIDSQHEDTLTSKIIDNDDINLKEESKEEVEDDQEDVLDETIKANILDNKKENEIPNDVTSSFKEDEQITENPDETIQEFNNEPNDFDTYEEYHNIEENSNNKSGVLSKIKNLFGKSSDITSNENSEFYNYIHVRKNNGFLSRKTKLVFSLILNIYFILIGIKVISYTSSMGNLVLVILVLLLMQIYFIVIDRRILKKENDFVKSDCLSTIIDKVETDKENEVIHEVIKTEEKSLEPKEVKKLKLLSTDDLHKKLSLISTSLKGFLSTKGLNLSDEDICQILNTILCQRVIVVRNENKDLSIKLCEALKQYFGQYNLANVSMSNVCDIDEKFKNYSTLYNNIFKSYKDNINLCVLTDINSSLIESINTKINKYFINPLTKFEYKNNDINIVFPNNVWFLLVEDTITTLDYNTLVNVSIINPKIEESNSSEINFEYDISSLDDINEIINTISKKDIVPLEVWQVFDTLENNLSSIGFKLNSNLANKIEKNLNTYMILNGSLNDGLDLIVSSKLVPYLMKYNKDIDIKKTLNKVFKPYSNKKINQTIEEYLKG